MKCKKWVNFSKIDNCYRAKTIGEEIENWIEFNEDDLIRAYLDLADDIIIVNDEVCIYSSIEKLEYIDSHIVEPIKLNPIEKSRVYIFPKGEKIMLQNVEELETSESGNHRLKTKDGKLHIIPRGWLHIEIDTEDWTI